MATIEIAGKLITHATLYVEGALIPTMEGGEDDTVVMEPFALQLVTYDGDDFIMSGTREEILAVLEAARTLLMHDGEPKGCDECYGVGVHGEACSRNIIG